MYKLVKDNGKLYVQHEYSSYNAPPRGTRMWWEVERLAWSPYATAQEREEPVGQELRTVSSAIGPSFYVGECDIYLPDGGKTQACRIWRASGEQTSLRRRGARSSGGTGSGCGSKVVKSSRYSGTSWNGSKCDEKENRS